ncbi:MAG: hypothetical protein L0Y71_24125 [Gemmataceae bacterium]|nr:hypothetical protein [Gemmataceae bacterium]
MRRLAVASVLMLVSFGFALGKDIPAVITKVEGKKVTFTMTKDGKKETVTLSVADNAKFFTGKEDKDTKKIEADEPLEGGLSNKVFKKLFKKGIRALIVTDDDNRIMEIRVPPGGKKQPKERQ